MDLNLAGCGHPRYKGAGVSCYKYTLLFRSSKILSFEGLSTDDNCHESGRLRVWTWLGMQEEKALQLCLGLHSFFYCFWISVVLRKDAKGRSSPRDVAVVMHLTWRVKWQAVRRRFDKRIYIPLPDLKARQHMFKVTVHICLLEPCLASFEVHCYQQISSQYLSLLREVYVSSSVLHRCIWGIHQTTWQSVTMRIWQGRQTDSQGQMLQSV